jgi:hypothetical protein
MVGGCTAGGPSSSGVLRAAPVERPLASLAKCLLLLSVCLGPPCSCAYLSNSLGIFVTMMIILKRALLIVVLNMMSMTPDNFHMVRLGRPFVLFDEMWSSFFLFSVVWL